MNSKGKEINTHQENMSIRTWVKFCLHLKGHTLKSFGRLHEVTAGSVGVVFYRPYPRMEKLIADILEIQPWDLWPERYTDQKPNRFNTWYLRRSGSWKPKNITKRASVKENLNGPTDKE